VTGAPIHLSVAGTQCRIIMSCLYFNLVQSVKDYRESNKQACQEQPCFHQPIDSSRHMRDKRLIWSDIVAEAAMTDANLVTSLSDHAYVAISAQNVSTTWYDKQQND